MLHVNLNWFFRRFFSTLDSTGNDLRSFLLFIWVKVYFEKLSNIIMIQGLNVGFVRFFFFLAYLELCPGIGAQTMLSWYELFMSLSKIRYTPAAIRRRWNMRQAKHLRAFSSRHNWWSLNRSLSFCNWKCLKHSVSGRAWTGCKQSKVSNHFLLVFYIITMYN